MPVDLIVEDGTGLATANSYASIADALTYHETYHGLHSQQWLEAEEYKQQAALIWASRLLDEQCWWKGARGSTTQALGWPRSGVLTRDGDAEFSATAVPVWLKHATSELARLLLERDRPVDAEHQRVVASSSGGRSRSMGLPDGRSHQVIPPSVASIVAPYRIQGVSRLVRAA